MKFAGFTSTPVILRSTAILTPYVASPYENIKRWFTPIKKP